MIIRQATKKDVKDLASLIYSSAPDVLSTIFDINEQLSALNFLNSSLLTEDGQYGFANHWVTEVDHQVVACVSGWHSDLPLSFHQSTLNKLAGFYGIPHTLSVVQASLALKDCIPKPEKNEWCIGHFAVLQLHQRKGIGSGLVDCMQKHAMSSGKTTLCLDVESTNTQAIDFYLAQGFVKKNESSVSQRMRHLGIGSHFHLSKSLI
jgi:ribosomal protein S18 acetylase RimI-like enzyme